MELLGLWILMPVLWNSAAGLECGYPGAPAFGRPHPVKETYRPGDAVSFTCAHGYSLQGPLQRVCAPNGTWAGPLPLCDRSLSSVEHQASSRQTLSLYPASKSIDGDARTCTYTDKLRPRWVRLDMRTNQRVRAVAITVPQGIYSQDAAQLTIYAIRVRDNTTASYHKCAAFNGRFASTTLQLSCAGGEAEGRYIHVEDNRHRVDYFSLCEIQVFVNKGSYECGEADRPAHAYSVRTQTGGVEYRCVYGYRLEGPSTRTCQQDGQWSSPQPICREIVCPPVGEVANGRVQYVGRKSERSTLGTTANVSCDYGYQLVGEPLVCGQDGRWSPGHVSCKAVECGTPPVRHESERHVLVNGTRYGSVALLRCGELEAALLCREDGTWTPPEIDCAAHSGVSTLGLIEEQTDVPTGIVIGMAVVVFLLLATVVFVLLLKRKKSFETKQHRFHPIERDHALFRSAVRERRLLRHDPRRRPRLLQEPLPPVHGPLPPPPQVPVQQVPRRLRKLLRQLHLRRDRRTEKRGRSRSAPSTGRNRPTRSALRPRRPRGEATVSIGAFPVRPVRTRRPAPVGGNVPPSRGGASGRGGPGANQTAGAAPHPGGRQRERSDVRLSVAAPRTVADAVAQERDLRGVGPVQSRHSHERQRALLDQRDAEAVTVGHVAVDWVQS